MNNAGLSPYSVLIVDDDKSYRPVLKNIFSTHQFMTCTAEGGEDTFRRLGEKEFDLVITDLQMPNKDGYALIQHVRNCFPKIQVGL